MIALKEKNNRGRRKVIGIKLSEIAIAGPSGIVGGLEVDSTANIVATNILAKPSIPKKA